MLQKLYTAKLKDLVFLDRERHEFNKPIVYKIWCLKLCSPRRAPLSCCRCQEKLWTFQKASRFVRNSFVSLAVRLCLQCTSKTNTTFSVKPKLPRLAEAVIDETYRHEDWEAGTGDPRIQQDELLQSLGRRISLIEESSIDSHHINIQVQRNIQGLLERSWERWEG